MERGKLSEEGRSVPGRLMRRDGVYSRFTFRTREGQTDSWARHIAMVRYHRGGINISGRYGQYCAC